MQTQWIKHMNIRLLLRCGREKKWLQKKASFLSEPVRLYASFFYWVLKDKDLSPLKTLWKRANRVGVKIVPVKPQMLENVIPLRH